MSGPAYAVTVARVRHDDPEARSRLAQAAGAAGGDLDMLMMNAAIKRLNQCPVLLTQ
jgi:hypothetical protein